MEQVLILIASIVNLFVAIVNLIAITGEQRRKKKKNSKRHQR
ncbi:hypothetical protein [Lentibacillus sediminis]|nr:hypothetical protein [Lentibacillus sediminis]